MSAQTRNPLVDAIKAAVGLSSGGGCSCGSARVAKPAEPRPVVTPPSEAGSCGCREQAAPAPAEQKAGGCGCGK